MPNKKDHSPPSRQTPIPREGRLPDRPVAPQARPLTRRTVLAGGLTLTAGRLAAQVPGRTYRIAVWHAGESPSSLAGDGQGRFRSIFAELRRLGFVEGVNAIIDRYADESRTERYETTARTILASRPNVILSLSGSGTLVLQRLDRTIPVIQPSMSDPVVAGLASSLARPGGNLTGFTIDGGVEIAGLRVQLLKEVAPHSNRFAYLTTSTTQADRSGFAIHEQAAARFAIDLVVQSMDRGFDEAGYGSVFAEFRRRGVDAVYVSTSAEHVANRKLIVALAAEARLPAIYSFREFADDGGLMSYGANLPDNYRKGAGYAARILKGEKPGDLPIQQPTVFDFVVNLKTAKALGLTIPETVMIRATEVIE